MDFDENARTRELRERLEAFMDEHVYPNEARFFRESMELGPVGGVAGGRGAQAAGPGRQGSGTCSCPRASTARG